MGEVESSNIKEELINLYLKIKVHKEDNVT